MDEQELADQWMQQVNNESGQAEEKKEEPNNEPKDDAKAANFTPLKTTGTQHSINNLDFILDVPLQVSVHIGSTKMLIKDLLQLGQGSIIELNKMAGEPMDILVNDKLIARGEVVVVNDKFGIRLTDILSPTERVEQLK
ncbi:MAG TPA: flagellar motor switch protein FliN [Nitrospiraceae bacterium]|nr:MAG: flagellar motor switch protein FliN [Nitrospirae bacterium GWA2_42_11]OGW60149.1 MAG: flagellar motor switch protein FliN [Nitrospirae bacterium RIFCSPHIGHO2_02_FULL_42_12]HAS18140.1 flagellar motor switch protein FliN [Nitrospiraceae bacterium]HBI22963.1 flagellar motor switch protein FliN [Nitrospiraceae bacterium]